MITLERIDEIIQDSLSQYRMSEEYNRSICFGNADNVSFDLHGTPYEDTYIHTIEVGGALTYVYVYIEYFISNSDNIKYSLNPNYKDYIFIISDVKLKQKVYSNVFYIIKESGALVNFRCNDLKGCTFIENSDLNSQCITFMEQIPNVSLKVDTLSLSLNAFFMFLVQRLYEEKRIECNKLIINTNLTGELLEIKDILKDKYLKVKNLYLDLVLDKVDDSFYNLLHFLSIDFRSATITLSKSKSSNCCDKGKYVYGFHVLYNSCEFEVKSVK